MSDRLAVHGIVIRLLIDPEHGTFVTEYRTRDAQALLADVEWGWARNKDLAYVFETFALPVFPGGDIAARSAEAHVQALKAAGEKHAHAVVFGRDCAQERLERQKTRETTTLRSVRAAGLRVSPEDAYALTQKLLGEHD